MNRTATRPLSDLDALTGLRSGKRSYYPALQRSNKRLEHTVQALDSISRAVVRTAAGPRALVEEVLRAAAAHLNAGWVLLALADDALPDARPRFLALDGDGVLHGQPGSLPECLRRELEELRGGAAGPRRLDPPGRLRVPMSLDGTLVGGLVAIHGLTEEPEPADVSILRILANQAAVSMHSTQLYEAGMAQRRRAQQLYDEVAQHARELAARTAELQVAERRLRVADQRALLEAERNRIALELHDSVSQSVLCAGLTIDGCRQDLAAVTGGVALAERLGSAQEQISTASEQLRSVIYALHHSRGSDDAAGLPELLAELAGQHRPQLDVTVRIEGRPIALGRDICHELDRTVGEALFNVAMHAHASRATVLLRYGATELLLSISDDGTGDPAALRRHLRLASRIACDGRHRGLANMAARARKLGGRLSIRRSPLGGVRIEVRVPITAIPADALGPAETVSIPEGGDQR